MKITNFRDYERSGTGPLDWKFSAIVDVTTGCLWWKKTEAKTVYREYAVMFWFFADGSGFPPGTVVEIMELPLRFERGW